jgi:hypothetical protein
MKIGDQSLEVVWVHNKIDQIVQFFDYGSYPATRKSFVDLYGQPNIHRAKDRECEQVTEWASKDGRALDVLQLIQCHGRVYAQITRLNAAKNAKEYGLAPTTTQETTPHAATDRVVVLMGSVEGVLKYPDIELKKRSVTCEKGSSCWYYISFDPVDSVEMSLNWYGKNPPFEKNQCAVMNIQTTSAKWMSPAQQKENLPKILISRIVPSQTCEKAVERIRRAAASGSKQPGQ